VFEDASYDAAGATSNYSTAGTLRIDLVTISQLPAAASAVPEPATNAFVLGMLALGVGLLRRYRQRRRATSC
jgi:hypothetical protein